MGRPEFALGGGHHAVGGGASAGDSLLGEAAVDHAKSTIRQSVQIAVMWLAIWLAPVLILLAMLGTSDVFAQIALFFSQMAVVPATMGSAHVINFQPTGEGKAAITGDFIVLATEVKPLISTLRTNGIEVTAINHMLGDEPRTFFVHFWAKDDAVKLAQGLKGRARQN